MSTHDTIRGEVLETRILGSEYWGKAQLLITDGSRVDVLGKILGYQPGDTVEAEGQWDHHARYGKQFKAREIRSVVPANASGVIAWLTAYVPHFGRKRATDLVERYGVPGIWDVIEHRPHELLEVKGITEARVADIVSAYRENRVERDRMVRFRTWGLTDGQTARVLAAWGSAAEERLTANPYSLVELDGIGFLTADSIALRMGLERQAPARIREGARHVLEEAARAGHVYMPWPKLVGMAAKLLEVTEDDVAPQVRELRGTVQRASYVYLDRYDQAEADVAKSMARMVARAGGVGGAGGESEGARESGKEQAA